MPPSDVTISDSINDGWTLKKYEDHVYLAKTVTQTLRNQLQDRDASNDCAAEDNQSADVPSVTVRKWEYHILYSYSYNVPVLYFNVWECTGELLTLDELWKTVNPNHRQRISNNKWYTLTQQEHPYLFKPYYYFHPCDTERFMKVFQEDGRNTLITWLSSIGQIIWLQLDEKYAKYCASNSTEGDHKQF